MEVWSCTLIAKFLDEFECLSKTSSYVWGQLLDKRRDIFFHGNNETGAVTSSKELIGGKKGQRVLIARNLLHFGYDLKIYNNIMVKEITIADFSYIFEWQKHIKKKTKENLVEVQIGNTKNTLELSLKCRRSGGRERPVSA